MIEFPRHDRSVNGRLAVGSSFWTPFGEEHVADGVRRAQAARSARAGQLGLAHWSDVVAGQTTLRATNPGLLPDNMTLDQARVAFGEEYPAGPRGVHALTDPVGVDILVDHETTLNHITSTEDRLREKRYRLIRFIRTSICSPTEIWEVWHEEVDDPAHPRRTRRDRRRLYLTVFEGLPEFPSGIMCVATHKRVGPQRYEFTHLTIYAADDDQTMERKRRGMLKYAAHKERRAQTGA